MSEDADQVGILLDRLRQTVEQARALPMSATVSSISFKRAADLLVTGSRVPATSCATPISSSTLTEAPLPREPR